MKAPLAPGEREENETNKGLRVADRGFLNTAVIRSEITYIDGDAGGNLYSLSYLYGSQLSLPLQSFEIQVNFGYFDQPGQHIDSFLCKRIPD